MIGPNYQGQVTAEKALTAVIQEAYIQGISTRSVDRKRQRVGDAVVSRFAHR